jgi:DNA-binding CsgD family transcriptional regulator
MALLRRRKRRQRPKQLSLLELNDRRLVPLTRREEKAVALVFQGKKNAAIAEDLKTTEQTVKNALRFAFMKLGITDRHEMVGKAYHEGGFNLWTYDPNEPVPEPKPPEPEPKFKTAEEKRIWQLYKSSKNKLRELGIKV